MTNSPDAFKNRCFNANRTLQPCIGYFIDRIETEAFASIVTVYRAPRDDEASVLR
ncbi:MAG TPA: hypothetical protein VGX23_25625 [Actinocrinis sp.]|nr:hypothetical protein [Actinocrinis sp.]